MILYLRNKLRNLLYNTATWYIRSTAKKSGLVKHYKSECKFIGEENDDMQKLMNRNIEDVLSVISNQGHSGFSMSYMRSLLLRAIDFKPLSKLTFSDDEFEALSYDDGVSQNKRMSSVFKYSDGTYSYNDAISHTPKKEIRISEDNGKCKINNTEVDVRWHGSIIVIPREGDAYAIRDVRIKDVGRFNEKGFNIPSIWIEHPKDWWLTVCDEDSIKEFSNEYTYLKDYEYVKSEINFKNGKYTKDIEKLLAFAKKQLYKAKKGHLETI
jgi:hypothetical protein